VPLNLIQGPPNSGRAGRILAAFREALEASPVLVVPNRDDEFRFERELSAKSGALGGTVTTFSGLFEMVASAGAAPARQTLTDAQRLRLVAVAVAKTRAGLRVLRASAARPGFPSSLERLLAELQAAGLGPGDVRTGAATLDSSAYLDEVASLFDAYEDARDTTGRDDAQRIASRAFDLLEREGAAWGGRPVFVYGTDDLKPDQLELLRRLAAATEVTIALPHEEGRDVLVTRNELVRRLREEIGVDTEVGTLPDPGNTDSRLLHELERGFGVPGPEPVVPDGALTLLRSAGERAEAEAIAAAVGRLLHEGAEPEEIAVVLRDPRRRGPMLARVMESYGIGVALEAELPVSETGVGGALLALLEAEMGSRRAADILRWLRGPSGVRATSVDWLERSIRRRRAQTTGEALALWERDGDEPPYDLRKLRDAGTERLVATVAETATRMAMRFLEGEGDGPPPAPGDGLELQAAGKISTALAQLAELGGPSPTGAELISFLRELRFRAWIGPIEGRVRIADPLRLRAARFDHVVIGSLQDGEFPRRGGGDPFLSDGQRQSLGLEPRRDEEAEERYLFYTCLSLPRETLTLSYRDSDEAGGGEVRSPLIDDVRRLLAPAPPATGADPLEESLTRSRGLADTVHRIGAAPSEDELARALAARAGAEGDTGGLLDAAAVPAAMREKVEARVGAARAVEKASRAPGPLSNPAVLESLAEVPAHGGTTLEQFDGCSYVWFVEHELGPCPLDPLPDAIVSGGLMHRVLELLYADRPAGVALPTPETLAAWVERGRELVTRVAAERELGGRPAERAIRRGVERLLERFLAEEAGRGGGEFLPFRLEASFGDDDESERPALEIDGWRLHGQIDRLDVADDGRALIHDFKVTSKVAPAAKLEEDAKLQLQLYLMAADRLWDLTPVGAVYHPLRGTSDRKPRGMVLKEEADGIPLGLVGTDLLSDERFEGLLEEARERAGRIVARIRTGDIRRDPGPRPGLKGHDVCPKYCDLAPICRRDRAAAPVEEDLEQEEQG
jgi:ATP-dependent helicase/DNAse subunit B